MPTDAGTHEEPLRRPGQRLQAPGHPGEAAPQRDQGDLHRVPPVAGEAAGGADAGTAAEGQGPEGPHQHPLRPRLRARHSAAEAVRLVQQGQERQRRGAALQPPQRDQGKSAGWRDTVGL